MEYRTFVDLLKKGEKDTVDFKIQCEAFGHDDFAGKAELAKDICALANNGNVTSYIIIGVSDDGKSFKPVTNKNLTDDRLQDFCKKAIFPPPKTKLLRKKWKGAQPVHRGIEFVIIQIGPQPKQIFRFYQNYIDYNKRVCFKRNEVWIRRNATSDLATPEEINRLGRGQSLREDIHEFDRHAEREKFKRASQDEQYSLIDSATLLCLRKMGYKQIELEKKGKRISLSWRGGYFTAWMGYKKIGNTIFLIYKQNCSNTITKNELILHRRLGLFDRNYAEWRDIPNIIINLLRGRGHSIRRIWLKPIISAVPVDRITREFPQARRIGTYLHFYHPTLSSYVNETSLTSSSELLILDKIKSQQDYEEELKKAIVEAENDRTTLVKLKRDEKLTRSQ